MRMMPDDQREAARKDVERLIDLTGERQTPMHVWIDGDERVRRMTWKQSMRQGSAEVKMDSTAEYLRLEVPVDVDLPANGDVFDATYLALQQLERAEP